MGDGASHVNRGPGGRLSVKRSRNIVYVLVFLGLATPAWGANVTTFSWTASVVDGTHSAPTFYTIKCGTVTGGPYPNIASTVTGSPPPTTLLISAVPTVVAPGTYYCVATASNTAVESGNSNQVTFQLWLVPNAPTNLQTQ